jgi:hypothetical protein
MTKTEIVQAQKLIDKMSIGERKCLKEIYGSMWTSILHPNNFGKVFKNAVNTELLNNIKHIGIRSTGRCDEYEKL